METEMNEIYQEIALTVNEIIPEKWDKVYIYAEVQEDVSKVGFFYFPEGKDKPINVLDIADLFDIDEEYVDDLRYKIDDCFEDLWNLFVKNGQDVWTNLTFILESSGEFKIDYDYEDLTDVDDFERQIIWKYKYLGIEPSVETKRARQIFENSSHIQKVRAARLQKEC